MGNRELIVICGQLGPDQILEAISQTAFEVYFGITCAMIIALMYLSSKYGRKNILIDLGLVGLFGIPSHPVFSRHPPGSPY